MLGSHKLQPAAGQRQQRAFYWLRDSDRARMPGLEPVQSLLRVGTAALKTGWIASPVGLLIYSS